MAHVPSVRHLLRAKDAIDARYREPLDVPALARAAHLSPAHFSREFRRTFGETPHQYLLTRRLERAAALLRNTDRSVADICLHVGLRSVGSFTTCVRPRLRHVADRLPRRAPAGRQPHPDPDLRRPGVRSSAVQQVSRRQPHGPSVACLPSRSSHHDARRTTMLSGLTYVNVWVHDQDEALAFYTEKLGIELREDVTVPELGNFRWLTVGVPGQDEVALTLMAIPGPPVFDEETQTTLQKLVAKGAAGGLFFYVDDIQKTYEELQDPRRRVHAGADRAGVRHRRRLPRQLGQPLPDDAAQLGRARSGRAAPRSRPS